MGDLLTHDTGKQTTAVGTATPMEDIGPMILLVRGTPYGYAPAGAAEMCGLPIDALRHLAPVTVINPAKVATEIAGHNVYARRPDLITHRVHPCNTCSTALLCAITGSRASHRQRRRCISALIVAHSVEKSSPYLYKFDIFEGYRLCIFSRACFRKGSTSLTVGEAWRGCQRSPSRPNCKVALKQAQ
jgi:hypothetical protein